MKGVVFTEFLEMVETAFSIEAAEQLIEESRLPSGGAYTAVGTYDHHELIELVNCLSAKVHKHPAELLHEFGWHLFHRFVSGFPQFFAGVDSSFEFLQHVDDYIHVEVRKLYPDAELPGFESRLIEPGRLELVYRSERPFADLAEGLMAACAEHFGETVEISRETLVSQKRTAVKFLVVSRAEVAKCLT